MEEKGEYEERSGAACPQLPPDHLQRRAHGSRGDRTAGTGACREEEAEAGEEATEVAGQTAPGRELPHTRGFGERQRRLPVHRQRAADLQP